MRQLQNRGYAYCIRESLHWVCNLRIPAGFKEDLILFRLNGAYQVGFLCRSQINSDLHRTLSIRRLGNEEA